MEGLFITFEGPDGAGKTTQILMLKEYLESKSFEVVLTREPGGTKLGEDIRKILLDVEHKNMDPKAEMFLYTAARAQHVSQLIIPALSEGKIVLCDRFVHSSYAYQGVGRNLGVELVRKVNEIALGDLMPDLTLLFILEPEIGLSRTVKSKGVFDRLEAESIQFHKKVGVGFSTLHETDKNNVKKIDAALSKESVFDNVKECVDFLLTQKYDIIA